MHFHVPFRRARIFLLVDLREKNFRFRVEGKEKKQKKSSENDQSTGHFQSFFFFLISPEQTVKLVK